MSNNEMILEKGYNLLKENLGLIETEIFITTLRSSEPIDYTEWRQKQPWIDKDFEEIDPNYREKYRTI
jgi:hypothetical protein